MHDQRESFLICLILLSIGVLFVAPVPVAFICKSSRTTPKYLCVIEDQIIEENVIMVMMKLMNNHLLEQQSIIDHMPYKNVVCPKCTMNLCLTQPMLCYASFWAQRDENNHKFSLSQIVNGCNKSQAVNDDNKSENKSENKPEFDESKHGARYDMYGCLTPNIRSTDYCYHCPNRKYHPLVYYICQNCARYVDNPFANLNIGTNHVLRYQLNMFSDIFYDRYRMLINRAIGGQLNDDEMKQESKQESKQSQQSQQSKGGIDYVKMRDEEGNLLLIPKRRIDELKRREKPLTIHES
jgi:hypothetical protein